MQQIQIDPNTEINFKVNADQANTIAAALGKLPAEQSMTLIIELQKQFAEQVAAKATPAASGLSNLAKAMIDRVVNDTSAGGEQEPAAAS